MKKVYRKYPVQEVILFHSLRELTVEEQARGLRLNEYGNVPTGIEFLDIFAAYVRKIGRASQRTYAKTLDIDPRMLTHTIVVLTGQTPSEWVDYYVMLGIYETLLKSKKDTEISEISKRLGFSQPSVLCKYCTTRLNESPSELRYQLRLGRRTFDELPSRIAKYYAQLPKKRGGRY